MHGPNLQATMHAHERFGEEIQINYCPNEPKAECSHIARLGIEVVVTGEKKRCNNNNYCSES
jgi:hypothetical protein